MENYEKIINLPHHTSKKHPRLSVEQRAAQFSAFAALSGYAEEITETRRVTEPEIYLDNEEKLLINELLYSFVSKKGNKAEITYFLPDTKKSGGRYLTEFLEFRKLDEEKNIIIFANGLKIPVENIYGIGMH